MLPQAHLQHAEQGFVVYMAVTECEGTVKQADELHWSKQLLQHQWDLNDKREVSPC